MVHVGDFFVNVVGLSANMICTIAHPIIATYYNIISITFMAKATTNCIVVSRPGCRFSSMRAGGSFLLFIIHYYRMWYKPQMAAGVHDSS